MPLHLKSAPTKIFADTAQTGCRRTRARRSSATSATNGDAAVRRYAEQFDGWSRDSYRLSDDAGRRDHGDPRPAGHRRHRVRAGAGAPLRPGAARLARRHRGRDAARRLPRPEARARPGRGRVHPRRQVPAHRVRPHDDHHREGRRRPARRRLHAADPRRDPRGDDRGHEARRGRRDLPARRRPGRRRDGGGHGDDQPGQPHRRTGERLRRRGEAPVVRRGRDRPVRRSDRDPDRRRRARGPVLHRRRPALAGGARPRVARGPRDHLADARRTGDGLDRAPAPRDADARLRRAGLARLGAGHRRRRPRRGLPHRRRPSRSSTSRSSPSTHGKP